MAGRRLVQPIELPPWPYQDLLTNSVVQMVVDAEGRPASVPVLLSSSGCPAADEYALEQAQAARFEPVSRNAAGQQRRTRWRI